ncbi:hypothetical protein B4U80_11583, partial [Leptotrombidium deliense]
MHLKRILQKFDYKKSTKEIMETKNCVYLIKCKNCSEIYIGQTSRELKLRLKEHKSSSYNSRVYDHILSRNHEIDFENVIILHVEKNKRVREFKENWEINKHLLQSKRLMNTQLEKSTLPSQYYPFCN